MKFDDKLYNLDEVMTWNDPEWLVDGLVHRGSSIFLSGPPKTGKSLFALRIAAAVSSGTPIGGHEVKLGKVVFLAAERARLMKPRSKALMDLGIPLNPGNISVFAKPIPFLSPRKVEEFAKKTGPTDLLIVDTLRRCFEGGKENDNNDMTLWATGVESYCELTGAAAIVIHHNHRERRDRFNRPLETDYAGGGGLLGSLDAQFALSPLGDDIIEVTVEGANEGNFFSARMKTVPHLVGEHLTWVMVEAEQELIEEKPVLAECVKNVLIANPKVTLKGLWEMCRQDDKITRWWSDLDETTVGRIVKAWVEAGLVYKEPNPKHKQQFFLTWLGDLKTAAA